MSASGEERRDLGCREAVLVRRPVGTDRSDGPYNTFQSAGGEVMAQNSGVGFANCMPTVQRPA